ncbi:tetratricopeptide repeat protein [Tautonia sociabilis]|uniref:Tetratricopeptide repeat protein n=1 Tax=Tautonia sociabilis TaxID=2080755 RepID=A0A432MJ70_9BACT|nr:tetratricopeptide repeat protein [Tautonia sociabilis]RUL87424.1 tetratricopeptide repeat protein [Tautonia sociabilis]
MRRRAVIALLALAGIALAAASGLLIQDRIQRARSLRLGGAAYDDRRFALAHRLALDHLRRWPDDRPALLLAARSLSRMRQVDRAEALYQRAGPPFSVEDLHARADALVSSGRNAEAAEAYRALLARSPDDVLALRRLAALEITLDRVREASRLADRLIEIPDGAVIGYTLKGVIAYNGGVPEQSVAAFERVLQLDPGLEQMPLNPREMFWGYLGRDLIRLGRAADARRHLGRALSEHPRDAGLMDLMARSYEQDGMLDQAARCWRTAAEWDPTMPSPWLNLGRLALIEGDPAEAVRLLDRAAELAPGAPEPHHSLALAHRRLGHLEEAERHRLLADRLKAPDASPIP